MGEQFARLPLAIVVSVKRLPPTNEPRLGKVLMHMVTNHPSSTPASWQPPDSRERLPEPYYSLQSARKTINRLGLAFGSLYLITIVVSTVLAITAATFAPDILKAGWFSWVASYIPLYFIGFPLFLLIIKTLPDTISLAALPEHKAIKPFPFIALVACCLGIVVTLNLGVTFIDFLLQKLSGVALVNSLSEAVQASSLIPNLVILCVIAPVMEEIIFRYLLYRKLAAYGPKTYVLFSATVFALFHANLFQMGYAFVLGIVFAGIVWQTGKIHLSIIVHILVNFLGSGVSLILLSFGNEILLGVWGLTLLLIALVGLIAGIVWSVLHKDRFRFAKGTLLGAPARSVISTPGFIFYLAIIILSIIISML